MPMANKDTLRPCRTSQAPGPTFCAGGFAIVRYRSWPTRLSFTVMVTPSLLPSRRRPRGANLAVIFSGVTRMAAPNVFVSWSGNRSKHVAQALHFFGLLSLACFSGRFSSFLVFGESGLNGGESREIHVHLEPDLPSRCTKTDQPCPMSPTVGGGRRDSNPRPLPDSCSIEDATEQPRKCSRATTFCV